MKNKDSRQESGFVAILFCLFALVVFSFLALGIDGSNLMYRQLRLYNSVDSALIATPELFLARKLDEDQIKQRLEARVMANLGVNGVDPAGLDRLEVNIGLAHADILVRETVRAWLANFAFDSGNSSKVEAATRVLIPRANIMVGIDYSHSMFSPDDFQVGQTRVETALGAMQYLGDWLRPNFDRFAFAVFADHSRREVDFRPAGGFDIAEVQAKVAGLEHEFTWTNVADAFYDARVNFETISYAPDDFNVFVLLTDGATAHGRATFVDQMGLDINDTHWGPADYYFMTESSEDTAAGPVRYTLRMAPLTGSLPWRDHSPVCQTLTPIGPLDDNSDFAPSCLQSAKIRGGDGGVIDLGPLTGNKPEDAKKLRALSYYSVIAQADYIRSKGVHVIVVGIGTPPSMDHAKFTGMDPAGWGEKFFRRVALSPKGIADEPFPQVPSIPTLLANPAVREFNGDYIQAHATLSQEEALRMLYGKMKFEKVF